jgi:hypothetical protein
MAADGVFALFCGPLIEGPPFFFFRFGIDHAEKSNSGSDRCSSSFFSVRGEHGTTANPPCSLLFFATPKKIPSALLRIIGQAFLFFRTKTLCQGLMAGRI